MFLGRSVCCLCVRIVICSPIIRSFNTLCILYFEQGVFRVCWPVDARDGGLRTVFTLKKQNLWPQGHQTDKPPCCFVLLMSGLIKWWQKRTMAIISQLQTIQHCTLHSPRLNRPWRGTEAEEEGSGHLKKMFPVAQWLLKMNWCCVTSDG